jgi:hypothetical protein
VDAADRSVEGRRHDGSGIGQRDALPEIAFDLAGIEGVRGVLQVHEKDPARAGADERKGSRFWT